MRLLKKITIALGVIALLLWAASQLFLYSLSLETPVVQEVPEYNSYEESGYSVLEGNWYGQNESGLWEAYIQGNPYERGVIFGRLAKREVVSQEESFIGQIQRLVPSSWFLKTLKYGVVFFNRNLPDHVSVEYQQEIYGVSRSFADEYDFVGDKYSRILNYHAAHDIGHALQDLSVVGCTSFAVWNENSADSGLVVARNFDFYMGDEFAKNKIILFVKPDSGYAFASITWAGFMGVVSGMNEHGLTVTLNAAKSSIPNGAKTPISLLAREILQYARTIDEAYEIARSRETFVSESILIASASDRSAAIIEKSPDRIDIYRSSASKLVCANHYQSETFKYDSANVQNIRNSDSQHRFLRMNELIENEKPISPLSAVEILRDRNGLKDENLSLGNPKAINQLLAHHGIVFQPEKRLLWISTNPFQLGKFLCYDLKQLFSEGQLPTSKHFIDSLSLPADPFLNSEGYSKFIRYKELKNLLFEHIALGREIDWTPELETEFIQSNPDSYIVFNMLGDYYLEAGNVQKAADFFERSLNADVASRAERIDIEKKLRTCR